ncbi:MAG TPA: hypothetical protein VH092_14260, partial [Urbifossiella sp.]|nr:hypothetical protein [Urbifossiella sp.]
AVGGRLEELEDRSVPAGFAPGSVQGQDGWSGGTGPVDPSVDQGVDQSGALAHTGSGSLHISNDTQLGNHNGAFGGWVFSPGLPVTAGQPSSGAGGDVFTATLWVKAGSTTADGSNLEIDLGTADGTDRNTFLAVTNVADAAGGLEIRMAEPDGATGDFFDTQIVATNLSRTAWHRIDITATFQDGTANDVFQASLDGTPLINTTPGSPNAGTPNWGTFEGYRDGNAFPYALSNRLFFRSGSAPSGFGAFSDTSAQGFYIDDVSYQVSTQAAPNTPLAYYAATFETQPSTTYVDDDFAGMAPGTPIPDADPLTPGDQPAVFGVDAFATIQAGVTAVAAGGTVRVAPGTYQENVTVGKPLTLLGANAGVAGAGARGAESDVITSGNQTAVFTVSSSNVTIDGFTIDGDDPLVTGTPLASGDDANALYGVRPTGAFSNLAVQNDIITHVFIGFRGDAGNAPVSGNVITRNWFDSVGNFDFGYAVSLRTGFYADVTDNEMTRVWTGVHLNDFHTAGPAAWTVSGNDIRSYAGGVLYWLQY